MMHMRCEPRAHLRRRSEGELVGVKHVVSEEGFGEPVATNDFNQEASAFALI